MSATGAPTHPDAGKPRADFCISDLRGTTCSKRFRELVTHTLSKRGYSVSVNSPHIGNELIRRHGAAARNIESLQVEVNKGPFNDTKTFRRTAGFAKLQTDIGLLL